MATIIFENETEFTSREVLEDNGVTQDCLDMLYNGSLAEYEVENKNNTGCFNVVNCTDCKDCLECTNSSNLENCEYSVDCTNSDNLSNCTNCDTSSTLENCDNMTNCENCKDCNFCIDAEDLVDESFVMGDSEDEGNNGITPSGVAVVEGGQGVDAIDVVGDLSHT